MSAFRILMLVFVAVAPPSAQARTPPPAPDRDAPAFAPMPIPELMATAASPDPGSAGRALSSLLARGDDSDHALLRLLEAGTTQDARIALHFVDHPTEAAIPALLTALERHDDSTASAHAAARSLRACVPASYAPPLPAPVTDDDGQEESPRAWRDWGREHRRSAAAACLGRSSLSALPLVVMLWNSRRRKDRPPSDSSLPRGRRGVEWKSGRGGLS